MPTVTTIEDVSNIRSISAAVTANAGAIALQNINGALKQVDDQGTVTSLGGGGTGTVTSVAATASGLLAVAGTPTVAPTVGIAAMADQTIIGNVSGVSAVPIALTAAQTRTMLGVQVASAVAITGGTIDGITRLSSGTPTTQSGTWQASTTTNGDVIGLFVVNRSTGTAAMSSIALGTHDDESGPFLELSLLGASFTTAGNFTAGSLLSRIIGGTGHYVIQNAQASGDILFQTGTGLGTEQMRIAHDGTTTFTGRMALAAPNLAANNTVATVLGSVGPTGSHTTVQEWMLVKGSGGADRWIPMF